MADHGGPLRHRALRAAVLAAWTASPGALPRGRQRRGGLRARRLPRPGDRRAGAERRRRRARGPGCPAGCGWSLRRRGADRRQHRCPARRRRGEGLSTLRASAKRDEAARSGRFGVGFAAVVSVCDEPVIASRGPGAVRWSADARPPRWWPPSPRWPRNSPRRDGHVPLLRLPFPADAVDVPEGFDTVVRLPLRDEAAEQAVRRMLAETGPALLLGLPALAVIEIDVDGEVARRSPPTAGRWSRPPGGSPPSRRPSCSPTGPPRSAPGRTGWSAGRCRSSAAAPRTRRRPACRRCVHAPTPERRAAGPARAADRHVPDGHRPPARRPRAR